MQNLPGSDLGAQADHSAPNGGVGVEEPPVVSPATAMGTDVRQEPEQLDMEDEEDTEEPEAVQPITGTVRVY